MPAGDVARRSVIDGQQRLTTLQLLSHLPSPDRWPGDCRAEAKADGY